MVKKKPIDSKIKLAIISGIFLVSAYGISAYLGGPAFNTQIQERPVVAVSFGNYNNYPKKTLEFNGKNFYIEILAKNDGVALGKMLTTVNAENASVSYFEDEEFAESQQLKYFIHTSKNFTVLYPPIFIKPSPNTDSFSIEITATDDPSKHPYQELGVYLPTKLVYKNIDGNFVLVNKK